MKVTANSSIWLYYCLYNVHTLYVCIQPILTFHYWAQANDSIRKGSVHSPHESLLTEYFLTYIEANISHYNYLKNNFDCFFRGFILIFGADLFEYLSIKTRIIKIILQ